MVRLDYHNNLQQTADDDGNLHRIELTIPKRTRLPEKIVAYVMLDVFPIFSMRLDG